MKKQEQVYCVAKCSETWCGRNKKHHPVKSVRGFAQADFSDRCEYFAK